MVIIDLGLKDVKLKTSSFIKKYLFVSTLFILRPMALSLKSTIDFLMYNNIINKGV